MELLKVIESRIRDVLALNHSFAFQPDMDSIIKAYLDLALEYADIEDFSRMAVLLLKVVLGWDASFYVTQGDDCEAALQASTQPEIMDCRKEGQAPSLRLADTPGREGNDYHFPLDVRGKTQRSNPEPDFGPLIGQICVRPGRDLTETELLFLAKYADVVALSLYHRLLSRRNEQHLAFIKKLVADIGHNVIMPNIFFKAYLRRLAGKIESLKEIQDRLSRLTQSAPQLLPTKVRDLNAELANTGEGIQEEFEHILKHYVNTSLFLETLLRQSHFEKGRYVLKKKTCNFRKDIISPQVDRILSKLRERRIEVDLSMGGVPDQILEAVVDVGLISQVYANLLSNAVKYTRPVPWGNGERKFIAYGLDLLPGAFGYGADGIKLNLFSSGPAINTEDRPFIFDEGYRGTNVERERGTGHGLFFVKEVVELHGGKVGYEPTDMGNNFYFILPR
ncbi:MAG: sensor histidine kinase [Proteobacteria bacterium]|nr:sensor histidine kinase [Pseudomonadota bacterium]